MALTKDLRITTTEMHTGGEAVRIIESGWPELEGTTILDKRRCARERDDALRRFVMFEPRGHYDMYGAILVKPDLADADLAVLFMHNEGYSTMCGHAIIALGRYALNQGLVAPSDGPTTEVKFQCPCGLVRAYVETINGKPGIGVKFHSVPAFAYKLDVEVEVAGHGTLRVDIGYGGAFYALIPAALLGRDVSTDSTNDLVQAARRVSDAVKAQIAIHHPDSEDLSFLYGTILTDGQDDFSDTPTANLCVFADSEVDRSPTGSGVTARLAVQFARGQIALGQTRKFANGITGSSFTGSVHSATTCGDLPAIVAEVGGRAFYSGTATFMLEEEDDLKQGFLMRS